MIEKPMFLNAGKYNIFAICHETTNNNNTGFIFCYPFAEEKLWAQRLYVNFARELASKGYPVIRFDFMGHGDSDGKFEESTVETRLFDLDVVLSHFKKMIGEDSQINLFGLRFGGTIAALYADQYKNINKLILWDPIVNGDDYFQELLRINLTTQMAVFKKIIYNREYLINKLKNFDTVNIDGYEISNQFYSQVSKVDLIKNKLSFKGETLIIQISRKAQSYKKELQLLNENYLKSELQIAIEEPFWREIKTYHPKSHVLFKLTLDWLKL